MIQNLKALVVVLGIAGVVFVLAKPLCLRFMRAEDYARRRNVWIALTCVAFASPSFWLYVLAAIPLLAWAARRDDNPLAVYVLMLHVIPPVAVYIPPIVVNQFFDVNNYRILSFAILVPAAWRLFHAKDERASGSLRLLDVLVVGYGVLQLLLMMPYESVTNTLRRTFLWTLDVFVLYYAFSRGCRERPAILDVMASYCLACAIMVPVALFESIKGWLLYQGLGELWGSATPWSYLYRGSFLRGQASAGHSLALGYVLAVGFVFSLHLGSLARSRAAAIAVATVMWIGMIAAFARGPWLVAILGCVAYVALRPRGFAMATGYVATAIVAVAGVLLSPIGGTIVDSLPFLGTLDAENVAYRERLAEVSWRLVQQHPFLGNPFVLRQMEELRQGQGIIDLVNTYASVALFYGLVGLAVFVCIFLVAIGLAFAAKRRGAAGDPEHAALGAAIVAAIASTLAMMAVGSFGTSLAIMAWLLVGLSAGYAASVRRHEAQGQETARSLGMDVGPIPAAQIRS